MIPEKCMWKSLCVAYIQAAKILALIKLGFLGDNIQNNHFSELIRMAGSNNSVIDLLFSLFQINCNIWPLFLASPVHFLSATKTSSWEWTTGKRIYEIHWIVTSSKIPENAKQQISIKSTFKK